MRPGDSRRAAGARLRPAPTARRSRRSGRRWRETNASGRTAPHPGRSLADELDEIALRGARDLDLFLHQAAIELIAVDHNQAQIARRAWRTYGKGIILNFGDCFASALAKVSGEPLLFKGGDFSRTDLESCL